MLAVLWRHDVHVRVIITSSRFSHRLIALRFAHLHHRSAALSLPASPLLTHPERDTPQLLSPQQVVTRSAHESAFRLQSYRSFSQVRMRARAASSAPCCSRQNRFTMALCSKVTAMLQESLPQSEVLFVEQRRSLEDFSR
jgi:hypothetical protein